MRKRASLRGTVLRSRTLDEKIEASRSAFAFAERAGFDAVLPVIGARFPLEAMAQAHRQVLAGGIVGRVAIDVAHEARVRDNLGQP